MKSIRIAAFAGAIALTTLVVGVLASPVLLFGERAARKAVKIWAHGVLFFLRIFAGLRHRVEGAENIPHGAAIVASNHQSMWETIALVALLDEPIMVFKQELKRVPLYGAWAVKTGAIPVDREAGAKAIRALTKAAREKLDEGCQVILFPEGTRAAFGERIPLQPGVASIYLSGGAPCTPVVHDSGRFWSLPGGVTAQKTPGVITIRFLPPIAPGLDRKAFMRELDALLHGDAGGVLDEAEATDAGMKSVTA
ncbi:MAG TPA: lysophospholipid acyltransferase family protein [Parvularculaceae bacterium]|nr:1-acyl-sn-glycerol-3-phosphate acyltransferase [Caulobacterales bacterium]HPE32819.1 lysophospholipid acyltransferase family protein [Parvularculaceae bacterium]